MKYQLFSDTNISVCNFKCLQKLFNEIIENPKMEYFDNRNKSNCVTQTGISIFQELITITLIDISVLDNTNRNFDNGNGNFDNGNK